MNIGRRIEAYTQKEEASMAYLSQQGQSWRSNAVNLDRVDQPVCLYFVSLTVLESRDGIRTSENDCGCDATYALQLGLIDAQLVEPQTPPAQSPQKVMSKILFQRISCSSSNLMTMIMTYDIHIPEPSVEVTTTIAIVGDRRTPGAWIGVATSNIGWHIAACKVPHLYP